MMKTMPLLPLKSVGSREGNRAESVDIWKARNFISEHSGEELSLTQVAKAVNISPNYLSEKFMQVTGINFVDHVAHTRFEKARILLHDVGLRVSEIACAVGFPVTLTIQSRFQKVGRDFPDSISRCAFDREAPWMSSSARGNPPED